MERPKQWMINEADAEVGDYILHLEQELAKLISDPEELASMLSAAEDQIEELQKRLAKMHELCDEQTDDLAKAGLQLFEVTQERDALREALKICADYLEGPCDFKDNCSACKAWDAAKAALSQQEGG